MPGCARKKLLLRDRVQVVHCYTRCVRRAFLAGVDPLTGKDFSYRRDWIRDLLVQQAALFGAGSDWLTLGVWLNGTS